MKKLDPRDQVTSLISNRVSPEPSECLYRTSRAMEKDSRQFRQYQSPTSVAPETVIYYKPVRPPNGPTTPVISSIPGLDELLAIKANLEKLLPHAENRARSFRKDALFIEKWRKGRDVSDKERGRLPDPDKKSGSKKEDTTPKANDRAHVKEETIGREDYTTW